MKNTLLIVLAVVIVAGLGVFAWVNRAEAPEIDSEIPEEQIFCTQDVKECPDGSYVPRRPPTCEFAQCPTGTGGPSGNNNPPVACTLEAKLCPDGSAVGRTGPNCEFAPCPGQ